MATALALRFGGRSFGVVTLSIASVFFYGWWEFSQFGAFKAHALVVLGCSIAFNFSTARWISLADHNARRKLLAAGVAANLGALAYFKYSNFLIDNFTDLTGYNPAQIGYTLPLAISFYTFQQIAFLVDTFNRKMEVISFRYYAMSVLFFPHLIAGPLLHYKDIILQFETRFAVTLRNIWIGMPILAVGLAKKIAIADPLERIVSPLFHKAESAPLEFVEAWAASLGYTAQLYFDFSGYSDMAIGLGLMFGIVLPLNFLSPYKSTSIIEFWRRWHITLSNFLRDYLYFPLGGSRRGQLRQNVNIFIVMLLGGLWHGAGWTFVFWGALHGAYLVVNHLWRSATKHLTLMHAVLAPAYAALTFMAVLLSWVFFRASSFEAATNVLEGMFDPKIIALPGEIMYFLNIGPIPGIAWGQGMTMSDFFAFWSYAVLAFSLIWCAPNTAQIFGLTGEPDQRMATDNRLIYATSTGALLWLSGFGLFSSVPSQFLYFQF